ncbi:hypothetical protein [Algibacter sp. Ld11]|uniref:hypothetical protein n=1 Tax=Algibacter sp. Ld11 TaxID=649150 RepID=UPI00386CE8A2
MKKIVVLIVDYKKNHQFFYENLINKFSGENTVDLIICNGLDFDEKLRYNATLHVKTEKESLFSFMKLKKNLFAKSDLIISEELYSFHFSVLLLVVRYGFKSIQVVHNANKFLNRKLEVNSRSFIAFVFFKIIKIRVKGILVISQTVKEYILKNKLFDNQVYYIPFNDTDLGYIAKDNSQGRIKFTIPGTVNSERRDYKMFLKVFLKIIKEYPSFELNLCLLGKIIKIDKEERDLISEIQKLDFESISFWNEFIENEIFHKEVVKTSFLIGNININYTENNVKEVYGKSKETGVLFLMLKYNKPTLFPKEYNYSELYENHIIPYANKEEDLYNCMVKLIKSPRELSKINNIKHNTYVNAEINNIKTAFLSVKN